ncbi:hypothetical protein LOAG_13360 [Loa loa]|uniref:Uncharacterized protein n=1 Tax=Loa loa TaxID=7209 RepID=A0A1S0TJM2_LOALO|nr:hypothetical protein LOAG_13360 [Loa loa]EFO15152.1 hypothetical protein LOAG_13360 [Loa loa]
MDIGESIVIANSAFNSREWELIDISNKTRRLITLDASKNYVMKFAVSKVKSLTVGCTKKSETSISVVIMEAERLKAVSKIDFAFEHGYKGAKSVTEECLVFLFHNE